MKIQSLIISMLAISASVMAQETYESAALSDLDLNGTARYVGMGGAMDALGADLSTINSNPAGIGLFRRSYGAISGGAMISGTSGDFNSLDRGKTTGGIDQLGFVYAMPTSNGFLNFAFNYHKAKNFNQLYSAVGGLQNASQNKLAWMDGGTDGFSQVDKLYGKVLSDNYYHAKGFDHISSASGYVGSYDFNLSTNIDERFYFGFTLGIKDMHYSSSSSYIEDMVDGGYMELMDERITKGIGVDFAIGAIIRPVETSPFRIGLTISTPTFYNLSTSNDTYIFNKTDFGLSYKDDKPEAKSYYDYDFCLNTPWRFGASLGTTFGRMVAVGAGYEYADYSFLSNRIDTDYGRYDDGNSEPDKEMNKHTRNSLKGVHTLKAGIEIKPAPVLAFRAGYNYVSPKYNLNAGKEIWIDSWGSECGSRSDYVNWQDTHRLTFGIGLQLTNSVTLDLAYQYSTTSGEYHPFIDSAYGVDDDKIKYHLNDPTLQKDSKGWFITNYADAVKVKNNRHQAMMTLGFKF